LGAFRFIIKQQEKIMKTIQEATAEATAKTNEVLDLIAKVTVTLGKVQDAVNRLEAKIAAGADAEPIVAALAPIAQPIADLSAALEVKNAELDVTGL